MRRDIALFLGLVALIGGGIVAAIIFFVGDSGGGNNLCDQPLPPMGESEISQPAFQAEDAGLTTVIEAASAGDLPAAQNAFSGDVRNFTYDIDHRLREVDEELAKELCQAVNSIEEELTVDQRADRVAIQATRIRDLVRQAAEALGYGRPDE
jgi:hypothetical protein